MKEILIKRDQETLNNFLAHKLVFEDGQTITIKNGEVKKILINKIPAKVFAKLSWLKSNEVIIDFKTDELLIKTEKIKNSFALRLAPLIILTITIPKLIWDESPLADNVSTIGLSLILILAIYAFVFKRNNWILIETKNKSE